MRSIHCISVVWLLYSYSSNLHYTTNRPCEQLSMRSAVLRPNTLAQLSETNCLCYRLSGSLEKVFQYLGCLYLQIPCFSISFSWNFIKKKVCTMRIININDFKNKIKVYIRSMKNETMQNTFYSVAKTLTL